MSTFHTLRQPIALLLAGLLVMFPISHQALSGLVLCISYDGHVEIEPGLPGSCDTLLTHTTHEKITGIAFLEEAGSDTHCSNCLDIPLLTTPAEQAASIQTATSLHVSLSPLPGVSFLTSWIDSPSYRLVFSTNHPTVRPMRGLVTLRI
jgi:hypothetical protein